MCVGQAKGSSHGRVLGEKLLAKKINCEGLAQSNKIYVLQGAYAITGGKGHELDM